jgi:hypothetical protein
MLYVPALYSVKGEIMLNAVDSSKHEAYINKT